MHFIRPREYEAIMPDYLPAHRKLVAASGVAEIAGGWPRCIRARAALGDGGWLPR